MGDTEMTSLGVPEPRLTVSYPTTEDGEERFVNDAAEIESTFGAKIISYEYKSPIENTFALFK